MSDPEKTRMAPALPSAGPGTQLSGIYELDERLASGGMGEVWRGHNIQTGGAVAIKIVLPEFARDGTILALFRSEASILNHLSHDAIVRYHVFSVDRDIGRPYLAMEFVDGQSLFDVMRGGPMPVETAARLFLRLAEGLAAVHEESVFHRDLSPDNIVLPGGRVERAKIIDFGIARSAKRSDGTLIGGRFAGKYNYVAPEQLGLYGGEIGPRSDIYSLGLVMAAAVRGKPLDMNGTQWEVVDKRRSLPPLDGVDERLRPLIEAMLQPDPQDRPESMEVIADWLRANFAAAAPTRRPPAHPGGPALPPRPASAGQAAATQEPRFVAHVVPAALAAQPEPGPTVAVFEEPRPGGRAWALAAAALVLLVCAAGAAAFFGGYLPWPTVPRTVEERRFAGKEKDDRNLVSLDPFIRPAPDNGGGKGEPEREDQPDVVISQVAERIAWLRDYSGGDCFYAAVTAATDKAIDIEGFGAKVEPFNRLLADFSAEFGFDPELNVRPLAPEQCPVTDFLRAVGSLAGEAPDLILDSTQVADGGAVSGTLAAPAGTRSYLLLVDNTGTVFNLQSWVKSADGKERFSVPIGVGANGKASGAALPMVMLAIAAPGEGLAAAGFRQPGPAAEVLPKILEEARSRGRGSAAAAKFFELGG
jgi:eukaryotic-like serine/threonine-protein kinase